MKTDSRSKTRYVLAMVRSTLCVNVRCLYRGYWKGLIKGVICSKSCQYRWQVWIGERLVLCWTGTCPEITQEENNQPILAPNSFLHSRINRLESLQSTFLPNVLLLQTFAYDFPSICNTFPFCANFYSSIRLKSNS